MNDTPEHAPDDLSRPYQELLNEQFWQVDSLNDEAKGATGNRQQAAVKQEERPLLVASAPPSPMRIIEALLFVGGQPLTPEHARATIRGLTDVQFTETIDALNRSYREQGRPYLIQKHDDGAVLALRQHYRFLLDKLYGNPREARLSQSAVDVLAIVAYRQPVTKQEVDSLRGHESSALLRQLVRRNLVAVISRAESGGRDIHYGTTPRFLDVFGLKNLDDLPQTEDLQRL